MTLKVLLKSSSLNLFSLSIKYSYRHDNVHHTCFLVRERLNQGSNNRNFTGPFLKAFRFGGSFGSAVDEKNKK